MKYIVIDSHAHVYPKKIARRASENIGLFYGYPVPEVPISEPGTLEALIAEGKAAGTAAHCVSGAATAANQVASINDFLISLPDEADGITLYKYGTAHHELSNVGDELARIKAAGLRGIKLHADCQRFNIDGREAYPIYEAASELALPILMHLGDETHDYSSPLKLVKMLRDFPRLRVVAAHLGGYRDWDNGRQLAGLENVWFDSCSSQSILTPERAAEQIRHFGSERCFFGTDYPIWNVGEELGHFLRLPLTDGEKERVLGKNFLTFING
ncbi:MAG: amidohydrolase [Oscillospiraceae bacterium]|jgi:predicted TIM-barrel fold metal-dependent hydrolase|nr:amidohydrolase [Oscillospiraceae bacterium]